MRWKLLKLLLFFSGKIFCQLPELWSTATQGDGQNCYGVIFKLNGDGTNYSTPYVFCDLSQGNSAWSGLSKSNDGKLYGAGSAGGLNYDGVIFSFDTASNTYLKRYDFNSPTGAHPSENLLFASNSKYYGVTGSGGASGMWGVLFSFDPITNLYSNLHSFLGAQSNPEGALIEAGNGKLYGMTYAGGINNLGSIFSYDILTNQFSTVFSFNGLDGKSPQNNSGLIQANNGLIYGVTFSGGINDLGVIFSFNTSNDVYSKLYDFNGTEGGNPQMKFIQTSNGLLYGTARGGASGSGVIFSFSISNNSYSVLHTFTNIDGSIPISSMLEASDGNLYGVTFGGGLYDKGVVYKYDPNIGVYTNIHDFNMDDGGAPSGPLIELKANPIVINEFPQDIITIYPNPVIDKVVVEINKGVKKINELTLIDVYGLQHTAFMNNKNEIDVSELNAGIYFLQIKTSEGIGVKKIVIQR